MAFLMTFLMRNAIFGDFLMRFSVFTLFAWQPASEAGGVEVLVHSQVDADSP